MSIGICSDRHDHSGDDNSFQQQLGFIGGRIKVPSVAHAEPRGWIRLGSGGRIWALGKVVRHPSYLIRLSKTEPMLIKMLGKQGW